MAGETNNEILKAMADSVDPDGATNEREFNNDLLRRIADNISGGSIDLGVTGAETGEFARVETVDANGVPTSWTSAPGFVPTEEDMEDIAGLVVPMVSPELTRLTGNVITADLSGEGILSADDAYHAPLISFGADGKSEQVQTTGKNLFDKSVGTSNSYINQYGNEASGSGNFISTYIPVTSGLAYSLSFGANNSAGLYCVFYDSEKAVISGSVVSVASMAKRENVIAPEGAAYIRFSVSNTRKDTTQFEQSSTATSYEPYSGGSASPRPDWPQEITDIDAVTLHATGKNLLDACNDPENPDKGWSSSVGYISGSTSALQYDTTNGGYYTATGRRLNLFKNHTDETIIITLSVVAKLRSNGDSSNAIATSNASFIAESGSISNQASSYTNSYATYSASYRLGSGNTFILLLHNSLYIQSIQLELGSTATAYEPYVGSTTPIPLQGHHLRSLPDGTHDELLLDYRGNSASGGVYGVTLVQRVGEVEFDEATSNTPENTAGHEVVTKTIPSEQRIYKNVYTGTGQYLRGLSNRFKTVSGASVNYLGVGVFVYSSSSGSLAIGFDKGTFDSVESANTWLAQNPTYIYMELITPVTHDLGTVTIPAIPAPDSHFLLEQDTNKALTYERDANMVVDRLHGLYANIAPVEGDKASTNYAVGSYLVLGGKLCKVTSAIATGEAIAIGTNVTATTVMAEVLALTQ